MLFTDQYAVFKSKCDSRLCSLRSYPAFKAYRLAQRMSACSLGKGMSRTCNVLVTAVDC